MADKKKNDEAPDKLKSEIENQTNEAKSERAADVKKAIEDEIEADPSERTPANVLEKGTPERDQHSPGTSGSLAGDLNAGEGNELNVKQEADPSGDTASSLTQKGPEQPHITTETLEDAETTDEPMKVAMVGDQDVEDVQDRIDAEMGNLAADPADATGTLRTGDGKTAYAKPGTYEAAMQGVQQDASGHFESGAHTRSSKSGTRV